MATRTSTHVPAQRQHIEPGLGKRIVELVGEVPPSREPNSEQPAVRARELARGAALKTALTAGVLALPAGRTAWLTIAPEMFAVWKMQTRLVADIAAAYGKHRQLNSEQMLYCLFRHTAASAFRDMVIRLGERYVVRRAPLSTLYAIGNKITLRLAQRAASRVISRWVPTIGALSIGAYVYYDTGHVADTAIALFEQDIRIEGEFEVEGVAMLNQRAARQRTRTTAPRRARKVAATPPAPGGGSETS